MAIDRAKLAKSAQKHLDKGNLDRAIGDFEKLAESDPSDLRTLLKLGDLYTKQGSLRAAAETYRKVAAQYAEQGFFLKAVAVFKQILKLDPGQIELLIKLGEMYELLSLTSDAIASYEQAAEAFVRSGKQYKALVPLSKIEKLDPNNVAACIRYAEALSTARRTDEAIEVFARGAVLLKEQGRMDDYVKVAERQLYHQPGNLKLSRELADLYLERDEPKHALAKLQSCFKASPLDTDVLGALARAFSALGQYEKVISVYREIGRIHGEAGRLSDQAEAMRTILTYDPHNQEAQRVLVQVQDSVVSATPIHVPETVDIDGEDDLVIIDEGEESESLPHADTQDSRPAVTKASADDMDSQVSDLMAEYEIFARYGLEEKVEAQLKAVLALMPGHLEARIKLAEHYASNDRGLEAAEQLLAAAEGVLEQGIDRSLAVEYCTFAVQYDPDNVRAAELLHDLTAAESESQSDDVRGADTVEDDEEFVFIDDDAQDQEEESNDADVEEPSSAPKSSPWLRGVAARDDQSGVTPLEQDSLPDNRTPTLDTWVADQEMLIEDSLANFALTVAPPKNERDVPTAEFEREKSSDSRATLPPLSQALPADLVETLEEYDFYMAQGMSDEAADILADALAAYPGHPELIARMTGGSSRVEENVQGSSRSERSLADTVDLGAGEPAAELSLAATTEAAAMDVAEPAAMEVAMFSSSVEAELPTEVAATAALELAERAITDTATFDSSAFSAPGEVKADEEPPTSKVTRLPSEPVAVVNDDMSFALAEKLAMDRLSSVPPAAEAAALSLGDVLEQFREGVRRSVERSDSATHYDLGIAYMEMGLHAEAIDEFTVCLEDATRKRQALTMIGLSYVAKGDMAQGVVYFEQALTSDPTNREKLDLWFEIGNAYELLGRNNEALIYYEQVAEVDGQYRQVSMRIERLGQPRSPQEEEEDFDAMFDNLILKE